MIGGPKALWAGSALLLAGCRSDPWADAPPLPSTVAGAHHYAISIQGRTVGHEVRTVGTEGTEGTAQVVARRRTWMLVLDGDEERILGASRLEHTDGLVETYTRWSAGNALSWSGRAWIPDGVLPPEGGLLPVLDPWTLQVHSIPVDVDDQRVAWTGSGGPATASFDDEGLIWATQGAIRLQRVDAPPATLEAFDPVSLLAIPVAPVPGARRALVGRYTVDGRPMRVDTPLWLEVPAIALPAVPPSPEPEMLERAVEAIGDARDQREAVRRLVAYVHTSLDNQVTPGSLGATDALRTGRGDCDEAAAVFVALAQSLGLEAETVGGLVYADGSVGPGLYPHAWATVRIGARKVPVDPGLGQAPADASHVPLGSSAAEAASRLTSGVSVRVVELR